jgi:hypothetical protein
LASLSVAPKIAAAHTPGAHVHGEAQAAMVINGPDLSISLTSAMYNITGFERAPQNAQEEKALAGAIALLEDGGVLFAPNREAKCQLESASHSLPAGKGPTPAAGHEGDNHNPFRDLQAEFEFACDAPARLRSVRFELIRHFENIEKLDVVVFADHRQTAVELTPDQLVLELERP